MRIWTGARIAFRAIVFAGFLSASGCTAERNPLEHTPVNAACCRELGGRSAGFVLGVWHGTISPVTFFVSLLRPSTGVYEVHNNGGWYNFGFFLGLTSVVGGGGGGCARAARRNT